ncbi:MAG: DGQHR domain-containing protein [Candidatus Binatus sp.]
MATISGATAGRPKNGMAIYCAGRDWGLGTISAMSARGLLKVSRFGERDPESPTKDGYQRPLKPHKVEQIVKYLLSQKHDDGTFKDRPTAIVVSCRVPSDRVQEFVDLYNKGEIAAINKRFGDMVLIEIDGQHRAEGAIKATIVDPSYDPLIPIVFFFGIDFREETDQFNIINTNQSKLQKALVEWNRVRITEAGSLDHAQVVRTIARRLATEPGSPFASIGVSLSGAREPGKHITFEGLRRSTYNMLPSRLLDRIRSKKKDPYEVTLEYWKAVAATCEDYWTTEGEKVVKVDEHEGGEIEKHEETISSRLVELVGIAAVARLGQDIIASALEHTVPLDRMRELVQKLEEVDWWKRPDNDWVSTQAGFAGQKALYEKLYNLVYEIEANVAA